jgi:hypothetical protein
MLTCKRKRCVVGSRNRLAVLVEVFTSNNAVLKAAMLAEFLCVGEVHYFMAVS